LISSRKEAQVIQEAAIREGFRPLREDAIGKVVSGVTTIEELLRVTQDFKIT